MLLLPSAAIAGAVEAGIAIDGVDAVGGAVGALRLAAVLGAVEAGIAVDGVDAVRVRVPRRRSRGASLVVARQRRLGCGDRQAGRDGKKDKTAHESLLVGQSLQTINEAWGQSVPPLQPG